MGAFVYPDEYLEYYGLTDPAELVKAPLDLGYACDVIRDHIHQTVDLVTDDVITVYGNDTTAILLPELPVVSIASITEDGVPITDWTVDKIHGLLLRSRPTGSMWGPSYPWWRWRQYVITYTHGYPMDAVPDVLKTVAFQIARNRSTGPGPGVVSVQESIAGYSTGTTYASAVESTLLSILDRRVVKRTPVP